MSDHDQRESGPSAGEDAQVSEGPSGFGGVESAGGGADAVPDTPDGNPAGTDREGQPLAGRESDAQVPDGVDQASGS